MTSRFGILCAAALAVLFGATPAFTQTSDGADSALHNTSGLATTGRSHRSPVLAFDTPTKLSGGGAQGNLVIDPISVDFAGVLVGSVSSGLTVTLSNNGSASLDVTALSAAAAPFARSGGTCSDTLPISIAASESCTLGYTFNPSSSGFIEQTLMVTANAPGSGVIELMGSGIEGNLVVDPTGIDFGKVLVGNVSGEATVQLSNFGTASLDITSLSMASGAFARTGGTCSEEFPITIPASGHCILGYTFSPTFAGPVQQTLTLTANAPGSTTIELSGTGIFGSLIITPGLIDFSTLSIGETSSPRSVTLANNGSTDVDVTSLTLANAPFARTADGSCGNKLPFTILQGESCTLTYLYAPTEVGTTQQSLVLGSTGADDSGFELSGTAVPDEDVIFFDGFEPFN